MKKVVKLTGGNWAEGVAQLVVDSTGTNTLMPDALPQTLTYNGPGGAVDTITAGPDGEGVFYRQTLGYNPAGLLSAVSAWVKQ